ncbi:glycoside hydrolase family 97 protein [Flavisericum labens]|uniref:glycoside hydrolase family 97 protein n=1 Tax=Flavisericum labens TaxID=3377112 RepID=UPI00387AC1A0
MKSIFTLFATCFVLLSCNSNKTSFILKNPDSSLAVNIEVTPNKTIIYQVLKDNQIVIDSSQLGILRADSNFYNDLNIINVSDAEFVTDSYTMLQGKKKNITYQANQYIVQTENKDGNKMNIIFRLSDDGVAFRYKFPEASTDIKKITEEKTTYNFNDNTKGWLQPMSRAKTGWEQVHPSYEEHYEMEISVNKKSSIKEGWVYPALFRTGDIWTLISETSLADNYCGTRLKYNDELGALQVTFPQKEEVFPGGTLNPESQLPWYTPWRIITIGSLKTITESTLGTDLAENAIDMDTSFIKSGLSSWSWVLLKDDFTNYETSIKFIEYASKMNWPYCLIDADWDRKIGYEKMNELTNYAKSKNVKLLVWYNSAGSWNTTPYTPKDKLLTQNGRKQEFKKLNDIGVSGVKIDFFGGDGQSMIAYYHDILKDAAEHKLLVNFHGATLPRGWQRTYPHLMTVEAIKGEEFITFEQVNANLQPSHCTMLPFTRNVFDPMDFTPMVLDSIPNINRVTTNAFELALPVLFLSGIQHIAETPMGMAKQPDFVVEYLKDIPTNWDESKFIDGFPGKDVIIARRKNDSWFIVGINGENKSKDFTIDLSFIQKNNGFIIADNSKGFIQNTIKTSSAVNVAMKAYGGFVMKF